MKRELKKLEAPMMLSEVHEFERNNKKYRRPTIQELHSKGINEVCFYCDSAELDGLVSVYDVHKKYSQNNISKLIKLTVYLTVSEKYNARREQVLGDKHLSDNARSFIEDYS